MPVCAPPIPTEPAGTRVRGFSRRGVASCAGRPPRKGKTGREPDAAHIVSSGRVPGHDVVRREAALLRDGLEIEREFRVVTDRDLDPARLGGGFENGAPVRARLPRPPPGRPGDAPANRRRPPRWQRPGRYRLPRRVGRSRVCAGQTRTAPNESPTRTTSAVSPSGVISMVTVDSAPASPICKVSARRKNQPDS